MRILPILLCAALAPLLRAQDDTSTDSTDNAIHAVTVLNEDGTTTVTVTDPDKHTSEVSTYDGGEKLIKKIVYALDDNNLCTSGVVYTPDNRPVYKSTYKRDSLNRVTEEDDYTMADQLLGRFVYDFGPDGSVIHITAYDSQGNEVPQGDARKDRRQSLPFTH